MRASAIILIATLAACSPQPSEAPVARFASSDIRLPEMQRFDGVPAATPSRDNSEIAQDFLDLAFRMESGRAVPVMTRFEEPISVRVTGNPGPTLVADLRDLIDRLQNEAGIDIFLTGAPEANITIEAVPQAVLRRTVPRAACFVVPRVGSWDEFLGARRTAQVDWTTLNLRDRATVFLPGDAAPQEIRDCLHEEMSQAIGPLNDLYRLPDSVFNDDNIHAVLTSFDMLILRTYYAPELANGMTRGEVAARLPALLARFNPAGQQGGGAPVNDTSRDWIDAIETALSGSATASRRREAAEVAVNLTRAFGWDGPRRGFAHYAYGRLQVNNAPDLALAAFQEAARTYDADPRTRIHGAHVAVQIAAFLLRAGDGEGILTLTEEAIPLARQGQNAALLSTLLMFQAEALDLLGRGTEAEAVRLDSLGWARYGFGSDNAVLARLQDVQRLRPDGG